MAGLSGNLKSRAVDYLSRRLKFPWAFAAFALLLVLDLALPDVIPFIDEAILALGTALFAAWKERRSITEHPPPERKGSAHGL